MKDRKCEQRHLWSRNLTAAYYILAGLGFFLFVFTDRELAGIVIFSLGFLIFFIDTILDIRHVSWHLKKLREEEDDDQ